VNGLSFYTVWSIFLDLMEYINKVQELIECSVNGRASRGRLWILKGDENYKSEQRLLGIDQLNYALLNLLTFVIFISFEDTRSTPWIP